MTRRTRHILAGVAAAGALFASNAAAQTAQPPAPRLAVVIVVDQFIPEYLDRFGHYFGERGFNLFLHHGARLAQARYEHAITKTCAGHAVVLTGSHPHVTGIIANEWYNVRSRRIDYCSYDPDAPLLGSPAEGRSPRMLRGSTVGDVLRLHTSGRSRVLTVAGKDRSAIMLGGHLAQAAYWMVDTLFVTSTYYRTDLPDWARRFNASGAATAYFGQTWDRILPVEAYAELGPDDDPAERDKSGLGRTFPHPLGAGESRPGPTYFSALEYTPFQNELVVDFAMEAVRNEGLGRGPATDLLGLALSANDRVGHAFGPHSHEVLDVTVRTDRLLERFFDFLDAEVGLENTVIVLTADHGVAPAPEVMNRLNPGAGALRLHTDTVAAAAAAALEERWGAADWLDHVDGPYVYLNEPLIASRGIPQEEAEEVVRQALLERVPGIFEAHTRTELRRLRAAGHRTRLLLSFDPERSGHVMYVTAPYVVEEDDPAGTTHGSPWSYDSHVPILFFGGAIEPGTYHTAASVADIAPTLSAILRIRPPAAAEGRVLTEILRDPDADRRAAARP